ncbi:hypothetical protein BW730_11285 [Tessaracoccus aquimaris]|uniref:DUF6457 domain-containing protein n=1 Tax=Tessaracoccus aquimaris TaxID=1332264 RepID=A0A1Q2CPF7_9ACTN|nr:DUF6457 domain-containing protein [Tessaracoccus aquimaris]AQP47984.1 hypothetical protein BW730_11285 [Tessaracoccus aquimaris]
MARPDDDHELWRRWITLAAGELGLSPDDVPVDDLLRLTAVIAHGVDRPMAPVSAFLVGLAMGRGADREEAIKKLTGLAQEFAS